MEELRSQLFTTDTFAGFNRRREAQNTLASYGHLAPGETVSAALLSAVEGSREKYEELMALCERVRNALVQSTPLSDEDITKAIECGLHDMSGQNFEGKNLRNKLFVNGFDFWGARFAGARVDGANFHGSKIHAAHIPTIVVGSTARESEIDLMVGAHTLLKQHWNVPEVSNDRADSVSSVERRLDDLLLSPAGSYARQKSVLIFEEETLLGCVLGYTERDFVAFKTVFDESGNAIFRKGMAYALDTVLMASLKSRSTLYEKEKLWRMAHMERLWSVRKRTPLAHVPFGRNNYRFLSVASLYSRVDEFVKEVAEGKKQMIDISPRDWTR